MNTMLAKPATALEMTNQKLHSFVHEFKAGQSLERGLARLGMQLAEARCTPVLMFVYGDVGQYQETMHVMRRTLGPVEWPVNWVQGASCDGAPVAGVQVFAIDSLCESLQRLMHEGRVVATVFEDEGVRHCLVGGLVPADVKISEGAQTTAVIEALDKVLAAAGLGLADLARTWFYNREILAWYGDFNKARTALYNKVAFELGATPASTAVAGLNPFGAALQLAAWAVRGPENAVVLREVQSPLQCPAPAYGSSFSRASELVCLGQNRLLVSGTASIEPQGKTVHLGDPVKQVELTMEVVEAMMQSAGYELGQTVRALCYFKDPSYAVVFQAWLARRGMKSFPKIDVHCDICRDDLLFEIELDAEKAGGHSL